MPVEKRSFTVTEIKAGVFVLAAALTLAGFVALIRGCGLAGEEVKRFSADFGSIHGLNLGAEVRFGGVKAGKVTAIRPDPDNRSRILVGFQVHDEIPVNRDSVATIEQISLTTGMHLEISTGSPDAPLHESGDHLTSRDGGGDLFDVPDVEGVIARLETVLDGLVTLLGVERAQAEAAATGEGVVDLAKVTAALERALTAGTATLENVGETVAENRDGLRELVERLADVTEAADELIVNLNEAVAENRPPLRAATGNLEQLTEDAVRQLEALTGSLAVTLDYLQSTAGAASALVDDQGPTLEQILINLEAVTRNLRQLSGRLAEQPNALVRGLEPKGRRNGDSP